MENARGEDRKEEEQARSRGSDAGKTPAHECVAGQKVKGSVYSRASKKKKFATSVAKKKRKKGRTQVHL